MNPTQLKFIQQCYPLASMAGGAFDLNPTVIMAQSAIETGWGTSELCTRYCNYFGISAYGKKNVWWQGDYVELDVNSIKFRRYPDASSSFMDYARLIRSAYPAVPSSASAARLINLLKNTNAQHRAEKMPDQVRMTKDAGSSPA